MRGIRFGGTSLALGLLSMAVIGSHAIACDHSGIEFHTGLVNQVWKEYSRSGTVVVREDGAVLSHGLRGWSSCETGRLVFELDYFGGQRDYDGATSRGATHRTLVQIEGLDLRIGQDFELSLFGLGWRINASRFRREIESRGPVAGYPEHYTRFGLTGVVRKSFYANHHFDLSAQARLGASWSRLDVDLPFADPAELRIPVSTFYGVALDFTTKSLFEDRGFKVFVRAELLVDRFRESHVATVFRDGFAVGAIRHPDSRLDSAFIGIGLTRLIW
jgi:hypothetical protein